MPKKYRSRTDIIVQILQTTAQNVSATKTKIMYNAFLSFPQLKEYLSLLIQNSLMTYDELEQAYRVTEKGMRFVQIYNSMNNYVKTQEA